MLQRGKVNLMYDQECVRLSGSTGGADSDAGQLTHPQVVHPPADPAVLVGDLLLKVLIEAGLDGGEPGQRWPVVLLHCRGKASSHILDTSHVDPDPPRCRLSSSSSPPLLAAVAPPLFCSSCSLRSSSAAFLSSSCCCLFRLA